MSARHKVRANIGEEAAEWFVTNRHGVPDPVQRARFAAWLKASPVHIEEYLGVALVAHDLRQAADPGVSLEELLADTRDADTDVRSIGTDSATLAAPGSRVQWRFAVAAAALGTAVALTFLWWGADHTSEVRYATGHGQQITQRLPDDSQLHLDTDTAVTVRYSRTERVAEIARGQVLFQVAHEAARPFRVIAGAAEVVDVGTRFDAYLLRDATLVTVLEGQVEVSLAAHLHRAPAGDRAVSVHAGEQIRVAAGKLPWQASPADTQRNTAWLRRQIIFEQEPLEAVAAEFNRYSAVPIEIETPSLGALAISGTFSADDTESFVAFLKTVEGVRVEVTPTQVRVSGM